ncbi:hypothetical protein GCM10027294_25730 [Marinactinospora endophytica]
MRTGSPELADALQRGDRTYDARVRLGGVDVTDEVTSWSVDRAYSTGLPAQVALSSGAESAQAALTLSGDAGRTAAQRYSPWAPRATADIARAGQSAVVEWGLAEQRLAALRGRVRSTTADARAGTAQVAALDGAEQLRGAAWLPSVMSSSMTAVSVPWVVDHALRCSGVYNSPPARRDAIFFASLNRGVAANMGTALSWTGLSGFRDSDAPWSYGPYSTSGGYTITWAPQRRTITQQTTLMVDWWIAPTSAATATASTVTLRFRRSENASDGETVVELTVDPFGTGWRMGVRVNGSGLTWSVPSGYGALGRPNKITFQIGFTSLSAGVTARGWLSSPYGQWATPTYTGAAPIFGWLYDITLTGRAPVECLGVARAVGSVSVLESWRRTAYVLPGIPATDYRLMATPQVSGTWWDLLKQVADAHMCHFAFDESGVFWFHPRDWTDPGAQVEPDATITAARELGQMVVREEIDGVANAITASFTGWTWDSSGSADRVTGPAVTVPASSTLTVTLEMTQRPWETACPMPYAVAGSGTPGRSRVKFISDTGSYLPVEVELLPDQPQPVVVMYNRGTTPAQVRVAAGGAPSLVLAAETVTSTARPPRRYTDTASIARYGEQALTLPTSPWVQFADTADAIAGQVLAWTAWPIPLTSSVEILPDPRLQLGDVVHIVDSTGTMADGPHRIMGYTVRGSGPAVTMTVQVRPMYRPARPVDAGLNPDPVADPAYAPLYPG